MIALLDPILKNNEVYAMQAKFDLVDFTVDNVNKVPLCTAYEERIRKVASMNDPKYFFSNANVLGKIGIQSSFETDSKNRCNVVSMYRGKTRRFAVCEDELKQDMTTLGNVLIIQDNLIPKHHQERPPTVKISTDYTVTNQEDCRRTENKKERYRRNAVNQDELKDQINLFKTVVKGKLLFEYGVLG